MKNIYKEIKVRSLLTAILLLTVLLLTACSEDPSPSLYDQVSTPADPAVISSIVPSNGVLAGVTQVTITGQNFSTVPANNYVYFNDAKAEVMQATATQLVVVAPPVTIPVDSVNGIMYKVKVWVFNQENPVELYSNSVDCNLQYAVSEYFKFDATDQPWGITTDLLENIYIFTQSENQIGKGIFKLTPEKVYSKYAQVAPNQTFWRRIKYGAEGKIYGVFNAQISSAPSAIYTIDNENAAPLIFVAGQPLNNIYSFDFDQNLNLWASGFSNSIFRITPAKEVKTISFQAEVTDLRIFNGYVYLAGKKDSIVNVWRKQIVSDDSLGADELYFEFSANYGTMPVYGAVSNINSITFAADGDLYLGTNMQENSVVVVHPDGSHAIFYTGLLPRPVYDFAWGPNQKLYYSSIETRNQDGDVVFPFSIVEVKMNKQGAPYYGRD